LPEPREGFIFWRKPFRAAGARGAAQVAAALSEQVGAARFSLGERLVGRFDGTRMTLWRKSAISFGGDVIEFDGVLRAEEGGSVIEGSLQYKRASKIQFIGLLVVGIGLLAIGALHTLAGKETGENVLGFGSVVFLVTLAWVYSSSKMRGEQIRFIEERIRALVNP
jgi:hypothetical protein